MPTLPAFVREALAEPRPNALVDRVAGKWRALSTTQIQERVDGLAVALREITKLEPGDRVALIAENSADWLVADLAILTAGLVVVPIFATQAFDQIEYILAHSEAKLIFVDKIALAEKIRRDISGAPQVITFEGHGYAGLASVETGGRQHRTKARIDPRTYTAALDPDTMAVLIYTSGTTGQPKGVMLSHSNITANVTASFGYGFDNVSKNENVLSVLPFSHIYEHHIAYGYFHAGVAFHVCHTPDELLADLRDVRPVFMSAVPRIFERVVSGIVAKAKHEGGMQARIVPWALAVGRDYMRAVNEGPPPSLALSMQFKLAHTLVLKKLRPLLGLDRLRFFCSGSAPLHLDLAYTLAAADIPITEGYGPTECSPVVTENRLDTNRIGTVGKPLPNLEIRIAEDGEILVRGPSVMLGYYKDPEATGEAMRDGWYHTGDIGELDANGYLRITDRKKEIFKTSTGKFVAPSRVEASIKRSIYVNQAVVVGNGRSHPAALIAPNWGLVRSEMGLDENLPVEQLRVRDDVRAFLENEVAANTADLGKFEQIRRIAILPRDLTIEDGELSPTLKARRRIVEHRYADLIDQAYEATTLSS